MYHAFYGFLGNPFEATPDPKFIYLSPSHQGALSSMLKGIKNHEGFISLTGEVGTGKTTLVRLLLDRLDENVKVAFIFHSPVTFEDLLRNILLEFGLKAVGGNDKVLFSRLNEYLLQKPAAHENLAVIIDEAQNLPIKVLGELGKLDEKIPRISNRVQIIFVGQLEFEDRLNSPGLRQLTQKIRTRCRIRPLTGEESMEYIDYRLETAGSSASGVFTPDAISRIIDYAKGIPRVINILCDNAFLTGHALSKKRIDIDIVLQVIGELKGPMLQKSAAREMFAGMKRLHRRPPRVHFFPRRTSLFFLSVVVLGGFILLVYGFLQQKSVVTKSIDSNIPDHMTAESSSIRPPFLPEEISEPSRRNPGRDSDAQGLLPGISESSASSSSGHEKGILTEIAVEKGQTISFLAKKYYRAVNLTLAELILDHNPDITNVHLIQVNQIIKIPEITKELLIYQTSDGSCKLHVGTFWDRHFVRPYVEQPELRRKRIEVVPRRVSPKDTWYRVLVGDFDNRRDALKAIDILEEKKLLPLFGGDPER